MKLVERIKKGLTGIGAFLLTIPTKVFAVGKDIVPLYGIPEPDPKSVILKKKNQYDNIDVIEHEQNRGLKGGII